MLEFRRRCCALLFVVISTTGCNFDADQSDQSGQNAAVQKQTAGSSAPARVLAQGCKDLRDDNNVHRLRASDSRKNVGEKCTFGSPLRTGVAVRLDPLDGWGNFCIVPIREDVKKYKYLQPVGTACFASNQYSVLRGVILDHCPSEIWLCKNF